MSSDLEISSGGAIQVDSEALRDVARRMGAVGSRLGDVSDQLWRARAMVSQAALDAVSTTGISDCAQRLSTLAEQMSTAMAGVGQMADTFEYVELTARQQALGAMDADGALAVQARIDELVAADPGIVDRATKLEAGWRHGLLDQTGEQTWDHWLRTLGATGVIPPVAAPIETALLLGGLLPGAVGLGVLSTGDRLQGKAPPVAVDLVARAQVTAASGVRDSLSRIPKDDGQVAVEKYTMPDGSEKYVAYIDGTRSIGGSGEDPWDMGSNWDMYVGGATSASYAATMQALADAGVPGDADLSLVTYSQGAAIGSYIAMDPTMNVTTVISIGNPTSPELGPDQTLVDIRHRGDPVSNLADGGTAGGTGSAGSFTVRATLPPGVPGEQHLYDSYLETAGLVDASGDPRVEALHDGYYADLAKAVKVERLEFKATRPGTG